MQLEYIKEKIDIRIRNLDTDKKESKAFTTESTQRIVESRVFGMKSRPVGIMPAQAGIHTSRLQ
jgi:hypothetical protein